MIFILFAAIAAFLGLAVAVPTPDSEDFDDTHPSGHEITIEGLTYGGSGCPSGTASAAISQDGTILTVIYDSMIAECPNLRHRVFCQLNLDLHFPHGFQVSIMENEFRGYVELEDHKSTAKLETLYYFSGGEGEIEEVKNWSGPISDGYKETHTYLAASLVWSKCGANALLNVKSDARVKCGKKAEYGALTVDTYDTNFKQIFKLQWKKCPHP